MTEAEWKILRAVKEAALERLCGRILDESQAAIHGEGTNHERFLRLFAVVRGRNDDIAWVFDRLSRSSADQKLAIVVKLGLVTDDGLSRFEPGTQEFVRTMVPHLR